MFNSWNGILSVIQSEIFSLDMSEMVSKFQFLSHQTILFYSWTKKALWVDYEQRWDFMWQLEKRDFSRSWRLQSYMVIISNCIYTHFYSSCLQVLLMVCLTRMHLKLLSDKWMELYIYLIYKDVQFEEDLLSGHFASIFEW